MNHSAVEYDYDGDVAEAVYGRAWDKAEADLDEMTTSEMVDHFIDESWMDKVWAKYEASISKNRISEEDQAEYVMQFARNDEEFRVEMIDSLASWIRRFS